MDVAFGKLTEDLTGTLERAKTALIDDEQDDADDATHYALLVVLKRIDTLLAQHNVSAELHAALDSLFLGRAKLGSTHADEIVALILRLLLKDLSWSLAAVREDSRKKQLDVIRLKRDTLLANLEAVLRAGTDSAVGREAMFVLGDLLVLFSPGLRTASEASTQHAENNIY